MATFISVVRGNADSGYTASVPDFPEFAVQAWTLDHVLAKAREALAGHVERLLVNNETIPDPTSADAIEPGDALLLVAIDVPDDIRNVEIDLAIPALSLARIDSLSKSISERWPNSYSLGGAGYTEGTNRKVFTLELNQPASGQYRFMTFRPQRAETFSESLM
ncbi:MAG: type II toxin-antitoxin system HicB family antitoxin [Xanthobacteraceae bacterium]|nr:type II toxin-antitoxin system HicB family antitoxin [Xanthobacteraceae bacterium]